MKKLSAAIIALALIASLVFYALYKRPGGSQPENGGGSSSAPAPANLSLSIQQTYPHDTGSFTQGLIIYKGKMYESTGENGHSRLMEIDLKTGRANREVKLDDKYFGEGITILNDTVYQLTWQNKVVLVYTLKDFKKIKEFPINTEGWGITNDGKSLIVSDGTSNLYYYDPATFRLLRTQGVTDAGGLAYNINELEYIDGYVYANQWQLGYIYKIDPATGQVLAKADLNEIWNRIKARDARADVPNGIAYDSEQKKIYITGKLWPELYEIQFGQ